MWGEESHIFGFMKFRSTKVINFRVWNYYLKIRSPGEPGLKKKA